MEESQELEKLPRVVTSVLKVVLSFSLIALALVLIIALAKITYTLAIMVFNTSSVVPYDVADPLVSLVSAPEKHDTFCLALEHYLYIRLPLRGGLDLLLCLDFSRFDDLYRLDGPP